MADDRIYIQCKYCGGWKMLLKHFITSGPTHRDNGILEWLDAHADCRPDRWNHELYEPGLVLHTEKSLEDGILELKMQNYIPALRFQAGRHHKYYAAGKEISEDLHKKIVNGESDKLIRCHDSHGSPLVMIPEQIQTKDGKLDETDPTLSTALEYVGLPIEKTYIVQILKNPDSPMQDIIKGVLYGYW